MPNLDHIFEPYDANGLSMLVHDLHAMIEIEMPSPDAFRRHFPSYERSLSQSGSTVRVFRSFLIDAGQVVEQVEVKARHERVSPFSRQLFPLLT